MPITIIPAEQVQKEAPRKRLAIPIISEAEAKEGATKPTSIPTIPETGVEEFKEFGKRGPAGAKSVIPTGDPCCANVCRTINNKIDQIENELRFEEAQLATIAVTLSSIPETREVVTQVPLIVKGKEVKIGGRPVTTEKTMTISAAKSGLSLKRRVRGLTDQISSLKDIRYEMIEKGSCRCVEEAKFEEAKVSEGKIKVK